MEYFDSFPRLFLLVHIVEILVLVFEASNLGFWKSTLTQAYRVGYLGLTRGTVGKTSISGAHNSCCRRFNPGLIFLFFFSFQLEFTRKRADWAALCPKTRRPPERGPTVKTERKRRPTSIIAGKNSWAHGFRSKLPSFGKCWFWLWHRLRAWKYTPPQRVDCEDVKSARELSMCSVGIRSFRSQVVSPPVVLPPIKVVSPPIQIRNSQFVENYSLLFLHEPC